MKLWVKIKQSLSGFLGMAVLAATPLLVILMLPLAVSVTNKVARGRTINV